MKDLLNEKYINELSGPLLVIANGNKFPVIEICVETGIVIVDVFGKSEPFRMQEISGILDGSGLVHEPDVFYAEVQA